MAKILILDDDKVLCSMLYGQLEEAGHSAVMSHSLRSGLECVNEDAFDVVLLDVELPDGNGLESLPSFMRAPSEPEVIIITGQGEADGAERAIVSGAWSYIEKPYVIRNLDLHLARALQYRKEKLRVTEVPVALKRSKIIGSSKQIG